MDSNCLAGQGRSSLVCLSIRDKFSSVDQNNKYCRTFPSRRRSRASAVGVTHYLTFSIQMQIWKAISQQWTKIITIFSVLCLTAKKFAYTYITIYNVSKRYAYSYRSHPKNRSKREHLQFLCNSYVINFCKNNCSRQILVFMLSCGFFSPKNLVWGMNLLFHEGRMARAGHRSICFHSDDV